MKTLKTLLLTIFISFLCGSAAFCENTDPARAIKSKIQVLNLLNGMELNTQQKMLLLHAAKKAQDIRQEYRETIKQNEKKIFNAYEEVLQISRSGTVAIPEETQKKYRGTHQIEIEAKEKAKKELNALVLRVKNYFEPFQLHVLENYKPCVIPPVEKGRIGQADDAAGFGHRLEKLRSMPERKYTRVKKDITGKLINKAKIHTPTGFLFNEQELETKLIKALDEMRELSDVDFTIKKEEISSNIKEWLTIRKPMNNIGTKIEHFLLSEEIIPFLEERIPQKSASL